MVNRELHMFHRKTQYALYLIVLPIPYIYIKPFLHQQMSQSAIQKPSLKPQTASNADVEARWLGKTP